MRGGAQRSGHTRRRLQFGAMALAVVERQAMAGKALLAGKGQHGGGIEAAGKQDDCGFHAPDGSKRPGRIIAPLPISPFPHQWPKKVFIRTFGCQMNEYDSDKMADVLAGSEGAVKTENPEEADIILFNTCSVREKAQEKVFHDLGRVRHLKQARTPTW
jgi:hypothetical protein